MSNIEALADEAVKSIKSYIGRQLAETAAGLSAQIAKVEQRLARVENRPQLRYAGVWKAGTVYAEHTAVTHDGSIWIAREATSIRPGDGSGAWILAVKRGRDAR
jgi:chitodextrinase